MRPYKWLYCVMLGTLIIASFYPFAYNYAVKLFLNAMIEKQHVTYQALFTPIAIFLLTQISLDVVQRVSNVAEWNVEPYVRQSILLASYDAIQNHPYTFFQDTLSGVISSKAKTILDGYDLFLEEIRHGLFYKAAKCTVNLIALFFVDLFLGGLVFVWSCTYVFIMSALAKKLRKISVAESESRHAIFGKIVDNITNMASIFSFSSRKSEYAKLGQQIQSDFIPKQICMYKSHFRLQIIGGGLYIVLFSMILFDMIYLRMNGSITIGDFAFVFGISIALTEDVCKVTTSLRAFATLMGNLRSASSILWDRQQGALTKQKRPLIIGRPTIRIHNLSFRYPQGPPLFEGLNLQIEAGEKIGLVGYSGAGKSTFVNLLLRYFEFHTGTIEIGSQDISEVDLDSLRDHIAVIPQDITLFHASLMENIRYGNAQASDAEVREASQKAYLDPFIQTLPKGYDEYVGERGVKLSGGQRQRVAIARAFLKNAPILILDEATSALDSETEKWIQGSLASLMREKTVIAIAHRLSTLQHMDRLIVLDKGRVLEEGTHTQLLSQKDSTYKKLWTLQKI